MLILRGRAKGDSERTDKGGFIESKGEAKQIGKDMAKKALRKLPLKLEPHQATDPKLREKIEDLRSDMYLQEHIVTLMNENVTTPHNGSTEIINTVVDTVISILKSQQPEQEDCPECVDGYVAIYPLDRDVEPYEEPCPKCHGTALKADTVDTLRAVRLLRE